MSIVLAAVVVIGLVGAMLLASAAIAIARIAIVDEPILVMVIVLSGISSLFFMIGYLVWLAEPIVWWRDLLIAGLGAIAAFTSVLLTLLSRGIGLTYYTPGRPASVRRKIPGLRTIASLLAIATALIMMDSQTGSRGWGWGIGFLVVAIGSTQAWVAPIYQYYLGQRLADIGRFEPELLASLNRGRVSRHVLSIIRRWTEAEQEPG